MRRSLSRSTWWGWKQSGMCHVIVKGSSCVVCGYNKHKGLKRVRFEQCLQFDFVEWLSRHGPHLCLKGFDTNLTWAVLEYTMQLLYIYYLVCVIRARNQSRTWGMLNKLEIISNNDCANMFGILTQFNL